MSEENAQIENAQITVYRGDENRIKGAAPLCRRRMVVIQVRDTFLVVGFVGAGYQIV